MSKSKEVSINSREKIVGLEKDLISIADGVSIEGTGKEIMTNSKIAPVEHIFADNIYVRRMDIKKGNAVVGAIHKHLHVWFLLTGHITVATEDLTEDYIAPCYILSSPGVKRAIYANEDSIFVNIHKNPTNTQDISYLEREIVAATYEEYEQYIKNK